MGKIRGAKHRIVVIDNYIDDTVLVQLSKRASGVMVDIYDGQISKQLSRMWRNIINSIRV